MRVATRIELTTAQRVELQWIARSRTSSVRLAKRAQIVLLAAASLQNEQIAEHLGIGRVQVGRWRDRYAADGLAGMAQDRPRGGRPVWSDFMPMSPVQLPRLNHGVMARALPVNGQAQASRDERTNDGFQDCCQ